MTAAPPRHDPAAKAEDFPSWRPGALVCRLVLAVVVAVVLAATVSATWVLRIVDQAALDRLAAQQSGEMETLASLLSSKIEQSQKVLRTLGQEVAEPVQTSPASLAWLIEHGWAAVQWFDGLMVARSDGELQLLWRNGQLRPVTELGTQEREALRRTLSEGKPHVTGWQPEGEGAEMQVLFTMPVLQRDGAVSAVVAGVLRLHSQSVLPLSLWQTERSASRLVVFTRDGMLLAHTEPQRRLQSVDAEPGLSAFARRWGNPAEPLPRQVVTRVEGPWLVTVAAMPLPQWLVARVTDVPAALALDTQSRGLLLASIGGGILLLALLAGVGVLWMMRPLSKVQSLARRLVDGAVERDGPPVQPAGASARNAPGAEEDDMEQLSHHVWHLSQWGRHQQDQGERERLRWAALMTHVGVGLLLARRSVLEQGSASAARLLGYMPSQFGGMPLRNLFAPGRDWRHARRRVMEAFRHHGAFDGELRLRRQDGSVVWVMARVRHLPQAGGRWCLLWQLEDLGLRHALLRPPGWQLLQDPLTQLPNRKGFWQRLQAWLYPAERPGELLSSRLRAGPAPAVAALTLSGGTSSGVLLFIDLDHFKVINDLAGHPAGDDVLGRLARLLECELGHSGWAARLGGDEFAVVLPGCSMGHGWQVAEQIRSAVQAWEPCYQGRGFALTVSIGLVLLDATRPLGDLVHLADLACYEAKRQGRNRVAQMPAPPQAGQRAVA